MIIYVIYNMNNNYLNFKNDTINKTYSAISKIKNEVY